MALFHGTGVSAEEAMCLSEEEMSFDLLARNGVAAVNLRTAGLGPVWLQKHGVAEASQLRRLGFDALHLVDSGFCTEASGVFGARAVLDAFVSTPSEAVAVAGSEAVHILGVTTKELLEACAGAPAEALAVLKQTQGVHVLEGVPVSVLLDAGVRAPALSSMGYNFGKMMQQMEATPGDLAKLGFRL